MTAVYTLSNLVPAPHSIVDLSKAQEGNMFISPNWNPVESTLTLTSGASADVVPLCNAFSGEALESFSLITDAENGLAAEPDFYIRVGDTLSGTNIDTAGGKYLDIPVSQLGLPGMPFYIIQDATSKCDIIYDEGKLDVPYFQPVIKLAGTEASVSIKTLVAGTYKQQV